MLTLSIGQLNSFFIHLLSLYYSLFPSLSLSLFFLFLYVNCEWTQLAALLKLSDRLRCKFERFFHAHYAIHTVIGKNIPFSTY